jgi:hypothetical protein
MVRKLCLTEQLIIPFGVPKWKIKDINIVQISPDGTYFESNLPFAYIDKRENRALQIADFWEVVPDNLFSRLERISRHFDRDYDRYNRGDISQKALKEFVKRYNIICDYLKMQCELDTKYENKFLDIYFQYWNEIAANIEATDLFYAQNLMIPLLPLPQAHLYLSDSLRGQTYIMHKVDFAFWTGSKIIAIEIDGDSKPLSEVISRDRRYRDAGIDVVHFLNSEIEEFEDSIMKALPEELKSPEFVSKLPNRSAYIDDFDDDSNYI